MSSAKASLFNSARSSFRVLFFCTLILFSFYVRSARANILLQGVPESLAQDIKQRFPDAFSTRPSQSTLDEILRALAQTDRFDQLGYSVQKKGDTLYFVITGMAIKNIRRIRFKGNDELSRSTLMASVQVEEGQHYDPNEVEIFRQRIQEIYKQNGFSRATVMVETKSVGENEIDVVFLVSEGPSSRISEVDFKTDNPRLRGYLRDATHSFRGRVYNGEIDQNIRERIEKVLVRRRFFGAKLADPTFTYAENRSKVAIRFNIEDAFRYELDVSGNKDLSLSQLLGKLDLDRYDRSQVDPALFVSERLREVYLNAGYPEVQIETSSKEFRSIFLRRLYFNIKEGSRSRISEILIEGRVSRPSRYYVDFIEEYSSNLVSSGYYNKRDLESGFQNLQVELRNQGFLQAKVLSARYEFSKKRDQVRVIVIVDEGPLTLVSSVDFEGNQRFSATQLTNLVTLRVNSPLRLNEIEVSIGKLVSFYKQKGYLEMKVLNEDQTLVNYNEDRTQASLKFRIYEGPEIRVGSILLEGNEKTKNYVIMRQLEFAPGDVLTPEVIQASLERIQRLNLFSSVDIRTLEEGTQTERRTVLVQVKEANPGLFNVGAGVSTELGVTLRGFTGIGYRNIGGTARAISSRVELSSNVSDSNLLTDRKEGSNAAVNFLEHRIDVGYVEPFLFDSRNRARVNGTRFQEVDRVIDDKDQAAILESNRLEFLIERDLSSHTRLAFVLWSIDSLRQFERNGGFPERKTQIGSLGPILEIDMRDNPLQPTKGSLFNFDLEYANPLLGSSRIVNYWRTTAGFTHYQSLGGSRWVWANSFRSGYLQNLSERQGSGIPISRAFFLGGDSTVRGFDLTRDSERIPSAAPIPYGFPIPSDALVLVPPGQELFQSSYFYMFKSEIRFPLFGDFGGAIFYDGAAVFVKNVDIRNPWRDAVGVGVRYNTPLGPIRADIGFKLDRQGAEKSYLHYITIGTF